MARKDLSNINTNDVYQSEIKKAIKESTSNTSRKRKVYRNRRGKPSHISNLQRNHKSRCGGVKEADAGYYFESNAKRYGLLREFRENGIL